MMNDYQRFIAYSRYSRWLDDEQRRETWEEIVHRYMDWMRERFEPGFRDDSDHLTILSENEWTGIYKGILNLEVMPSMRCMMTAGPALDPNPCGRLQLCIYRL